MQIRPLRLEDPDEVSAGLELIHLSIRALSTEHYSAKTIEKIVQLYEKPSSLFGTIFVAEWQVPDSQRTQLVGVASAQFYLGAFGNINAVFTHPDFVHRGIGRKLVETLEHAALDQNIKIMTVTSSLTAVGFYQKLDYQYQNRTKINGLIACDRLTKKLQPFALKDSWQVGIHMMPEILPHAVLVILILIILL